VIVNRRQLDRALTIFADHYDNHRPHRSLGQARHPTDDPPGYRLPTVPNAATRPPGKFRALGMTGHRDGRGAHVFRQAGKATQMFLAAASEFASCGVGR
jgi:hypothetical protein